MAQTKYLTVLPTSATTVENFLRDQVNIKNVWRVVQGFLEKFKILIAKTLLNLKIILALKEIYQWEFIVIMKQQPQLKTILTLNKKNVCRIFCINCCVSCTFEYYKNSCSKKLWSLHKSINNNRLFI